MEATISLILTKKVGALGRLASALEALGFTYTDHCVYGCESERCRVDVLAEWPGPGIEGIPQALSRINGVEEVLDVRSAGGENPPWKRLPDDALVNELVWGFPRIMPLLREFEEKLSVDERCHRMTKLGVAVGERTGKFHPRLADAHTVAEALTTAVWPMLKPLAAGGVDGSNIRITESVFVRRDLDMMYISRAEPRGCCFLTGFIQGMLTQGVRLPRVRVTEAKCQEAGDPLCYFRAEPV